MATNNDSQTGMPVFEGDCTQCDHHIRQPVPFTEGQRTDDNTLKQEIRCRECGHINYLKQESM